MSRWEYQKRSEEIVESKSGKVNCKFPKDCKDRVILSSLTHSVQLLSLVVSSLLLFSVCAVAASYEAFREEGCLLSATLSKPVESEVIEFEKAVYRYFSAVKNMPEPPPGSKVCTSSCELVLAVFLLSSLFLCSHMTDMPNSLPAPHTDTRAHIRKSHALRPTGALRHETPKQ